MSLVNRAVRFSLLGLLLSVIHGLIDYADAFAYIAESRSLGEEIDGFHIVPTAPNQLIISAIFGVLLFAIFGLVIFRASRGLKRWLFLLFVFDLFGLAIGGAFLVVACPPPCGIFHPHGFGFILGTLQDITHIGTLAIGLFATFIAYDAWKKSEL